MKYNLYFEIAAVCFVFVTYLYHKLEYKKVTEGNKLFRINCIVVMVTAIVDMITSYMFSYPDLFTPGTCTLMNCIYYSAVNYMAYGICMYVRKYVFKGNIDFIEKYAVKAILFIYLFCMGTNYFTHLFFYMGNDGIYMHGPLYQVGCMSPLLYVVYAIYLIVVNRKNLSKRQIVSLSAFVGLLTLGDMLQLFVFPDVLLIVFMFSLGNLFLAFELEAPDYQKLIQTMKELEEANRKAEAASQAKSSFLARMSHEIRTPINTVIGMDEMILNTTNQTEVKEYALDIRSSSLALLSIINDILDSSKIESGKMEIVPINYKLLHLIYDLQTMIQSRLKDKELEFVVNVQSGLPAVLYGDEGRIRQVLLNLLTNAIKYTSSGQVIFDISGTRHGATIMLHFSVKDTGMGIRDEDKAKLFQSFQRLDEKKNHNIEGTGLGLSITHNLLELMHSELKFESEYGVGSRFYFDLVQQVVKEELDEEEIADTPLQNEKQQNIIYAGRKVLVVDDNRLNLKVISKLLGLHEIQVETAESGNNGLQMISQQKYDLIFLDHMMPEKDGIETFHDLKDMTDHPNMDTPIIMLTANAISGMKEMFLAEGFHDFLSKPIIPTELNQLLEKWLG